MTTTRPAIDRAREVLAAYAHEAWSHWMRHLFINAIDGSEETKVIPADLAQRWQRQMRTPYGELSEREQDSDRSQADQIMALLADRGLLAAGPTLEEQPCAHCFRLGIDVTTLERFSPRSFRVRCRNCGLSGEYRDDPGPAIESWNQMQGGYRRALRVLGPTVIDREGESPAFVATAICPSCERRGATVRKTPDAEFFLECDSCEFKGDEMDTVRQALNSWGVVL